MRLGTPPVAMVELLGGLRPETRAPVPCMLMGRARAGVVAVEATLEEGPLLSMAMLLRWPVLLGGRLIPDTPDTDVRLGAGVLGLRGDMDWP